jgi:hypothetical protein
MGERGKSDLNKSRETFSLEGERSSKGGERSHLSVGVGTGLGTNVRPCTPGERANDHPRRCDRSIPQ